MAILVMCIPSDLQGRMEDFVWAVKMKFSCMCMLLCKNNSQGVSWLFPLFS